MKQLPPVSQQWTAEPLHPEVTPVSPVRQECRIFKIVDTASF
jgi:hypothetical protein